MNKVVLKWGGIGAKPRSDFALGDPRSRDFFGHLDGAILEVTVDF